MVATDPSRFRGAATVPLQDVEAALEELERVVTGYGFRVVEVGTSIEGRQLTDKVYRPFLERVSDLGILLLAHPYYVGNKRGLENYYLTNLIGNPYDSTVMVANLMFSGVMDELPDLKICVVHGGGFMPYQIGRLERGHQVRVETQEHTKTSPRQLLGRLYFDTITFNPLALRYLIDLVGADHVALGTDAPFDMGDEYPLATIDGIPSLTEEERMALVEGTAQSLLGVVKT